MAHLTHLIWILRQNVLTIINIINKAIFFPRVYQEQCSFGCQRRVQVWIHQAILWFGRALQEIQGSWLYYCWMSL